MKSLTAQGIVEAWGRGKTAPPQQRSLALLSVAFPDAAPRDLVDTSVGRRDALLLALRSRSFGPRLKSYVQCAHCEATLHFELDADEILAESKAPAGSLTESIVVEEFAVRFRSPSARDLAQAAELDTVEAGRRLLLERCVLKADRAGRSVGASELPEEVVLAISERLLEIDPLLEVPVELNCSICGEDRTVVLDIGAFLWDEVVATAQKLMYEVFILARGYGWSESEVLAMGTARRQYYLEMVTR